MSITHSINGPDLGEAGWVAPHDIANGTITAAMLADAYDPAGAAAAAQAASQPLDSDLTAIAALTTTPYGRSLLTQANAAGRRSTAALGTAAVAATTDFDGAGAAATAAAMFHLRDQLAGQRVVGMLSGGNLDLRELRRILAPP